MQPDSSFVLASLLQHNYLPLQRKNMEELPPAFSSVSFTPGVAQQLVAGKVRKKGSYSGYDAVDYKSTRFSGVSRCFSIPHPVAYASLSICIHDHWDKLNYISNNLNSMIRPQQHRDGRLVIMDYETSATRMKRDLSRTFGKRFMVTTDISNCFPSIYSHAIPWALVGFEDAKKNRSTSAWYNELDEKVRLLKRSETQGVAIGPATSNIVSEVILERVDRELCGQYDFVRYIDDYTAFCNSEEDAQNFVRHLETELARYKLLLNAAKTKIIQLPRSLNEGWITELALGLPSGKEVNRYEAMTYLDLAVRLAKGYPDGSVLKYALKSLVRRDLEFRAKMDVLGYSLSLAFHHPVLLPLLETLFEDTYLEGDFRYGHQLQDIAYENARLCRSDGMAWALYYANKYSLAIDQRVADSVLASGDCLALTLLYRSGTARYQSAVVHFAKSRNRIDLYELDQYWILLYELFRENKITTPYPNEDGFEILRDNNVSFLR